MRSSSRSAGPGNPELLVESAARPLVHVERVGLPSRPVQSEHQQAAQALAQRVLPEQPLELPDDVRLPAEAQLGLDPRLHRAHPKLLQARDLALRERLVRDLRQGSAAPAAERGRQVIELAALDRMLEKLAVELPIVDAKEVAGRTALEPVAELPPEQRDGVPHDLRCRGRRGTGPERVHEPVHGDGLVRVQEQEREDRELPSAAEAEDTSVVDDLERTEDAELHHRRPGRRLVRKWTVFGRTDASSATTSPHRKENAMRKSLIIALVAFAVSVIAPAAQADPTLGERIIAQEKAEYRALGLRSEALNQKYGLGPAVPQGMTAAEYRALRLRSEALNQKYGLGKATKKVDAQPAAQTAIEQIVAQERGRQRDAGLFGPSSTLRSSSPARLTGSIFATQASAGRPRSRSSCSSGPRSPSGQPAPRDPGSPAAELRPRPAKMESPGDGALLVPGRPP